MPRKPKAPGGPALGVRIGRNIKHARTQRSMTQGQLAEIVDIENVTLSRIETGAQLPSLDRLQVIADVLHVPLQALVAGEHDQSGLVQTIAAVLGELPERERKFLLDFVMNYVSHWKLGQDC
jgi:transcriptional regulator with XRE-family HTH domain